jgi:CheY-like chemotaxis protein
MPMVDGVKAIETIRKSDSENIAHNADSEHGTSDIRYPVIIAVTATSFRQIQEKVLSAGSDDFLRKPFTNAKVFEMLHKHLAIRFVYEDEKPAKKRKRNFTGKESLTPETLSELPMELLHSMEQGASRADFILLSKVIEKIGQNNAGVAGALKQMVDNFEYDEILTLLGQAKKG